MEDVHRDRNRGDGRDGEREFDELFVRFAHSDDAAAADFEADFLRGEKRFDLFALRVGGAEFPEERGRGFDVAVQAFEARFLEAQEVRLGEKPQGAAEVYAGFPLHRAQGFAERIDVGRGLRPAARHDPDAPDPVRLGVFRRLDAGLGADPAVAGNSGFPVGALRAPFAVFRAMAGARVHYAAEVETPRRHGDRHAVGGFVEFFAGGVAEER